MSAAPPGLRGVCELSGHTAALPAFGTVGTAHTLGRANVHSRRTQQKVVTVPLTAPVDREADAKGCQMMRNARGILPVTDDELRLVRGGRSFWSRVKAAARWVKDHVVIGLNKIGIKGKF